MKTTVIALIFLAGVSTPIFADGTNVLSNEMARSSYAIGMNLGHLWKQNDVDVDNAMLLRGIEDAESSNGVTLLTPEEMRETLMQLQRTVMERREKMQAQAVEKNQKEGQDFLAENKTKPGVQTLPDGLQYKILTEGSGESPSPDDIVTVNYRGSFVDGTEFDSSAKMGHPAQFPVRGVIPGWTEALQKMKVGSKWQLFVPADLAYGQNGRPPLIGPDQTLVFEIELLSITHQKASVPPPTQPITSDIIKVPSAEEMKKGAKIETIPASEAEKMQQSATN
jgi:FKBP-type peptidyl-prolyl cis-trans isomerase FklB